MPSRSKTSTSKPKARRKAARRTPHATEAPRQATVPVRSHFFRGARKVSEAWYEALPLPNINPDYASFASLLMVFLFVVAASQQLWFVAWVFLAVHLFLSGLGGAIARRHGAGRSEIQQQHSRLVSLVVERAAEGVLFVIPPFFLPWFPLFLVNTALTVFGIRIRHELALPLRHVFFLIFTLGLLT